MHSLKDNREDFPAFERTLFESIEKRSIGLINELINQINR
jgi:hypothetical protein